jgi:hypothetical protein
VHRYDCNRVDQTTLFLLFLLLLLVFASSLSFFLPLTRADCPNDLTCICSSVRRRHANRVCWRRRERNDKGKVTVGYNHDCCGGRLSSLQVDPPPLICRQQQGSVLCLLAVLCLPAVQAIAFCW